MQEYKYTLKLYDLSGSLLKTLILINNPAGWDKKRWTIKRHDVYHSCMRWFSYELRFVKEGKIELDQHYLEYGHEAIATLEVEKRNELTARFNSELEGLIDFATWKYERDYTSVTLIDNDTLAKFIARDEQPYNVKHVKTADSVTIDSFIDHPIELYLEPINITNWAYCEDAENQHSVSGSTSNATNTEDPDGTYTENNVGTDLDSSFEYTNNGSAQVTHVIRVKATTNITNGVMAMTLQTGMPPSITFWFDLFIDGTAISKHSFDYFTEDLLGLGSKNFSYSNTIDTTFTYGVLPGQTIKLDWQIKHTFINCLGTISYDVETTFELIDISIITQSPVAGKYHSAWLPYELFTRLLQLMTSRTDETTLLESDILGRTDSEFNTYDLDGSASMIAVINGAYLRGYSDKPMNLTFRDLFKSFDRIFSLGCWYDLNNNIFQIKSKHQFYKNVKIIDLGNVANLKIYTAKDYCFSSVQGGFDNDNQYEDNLGSLEWMTKFEWVSPNEKIKNVLDLRVPYRADSVGIEIMRRSVAYDTGDEDKEDDKEIFLIESKRFDEGGYINKNGDDFYDIEGIRRAQYYYNFGITPKRNLLRNGDLLAANQYKNKSAGLKYIESRNNTPLETQELVTSDIIKEIENVNITNETQLFDPILFEFNSSVTPEILDQLKADPHGYVEFYYEGYPFYGFIIEVSTESFRRKGNWLLIKANRNRR